MVRTGFKIIHEVPIRNQNTYVRLTSEQLKKVQELSRKEGVPLSTIIRQMVQYSLENMDKI